MVGRSPKVMIGIPTSEVARRAHFYDYVQQLINKSKIEVGYCSPHGQSPARNRNIIIKYALDNDCSHVFFIDDDVAFQPDVIERLLKHDVDMVCGLQLMRSYPHQPIIFNFVDEGGKHAWAFPKSGAKGLVKVTGAGLGCVLIKTDVFRKMEEPWIRLGEIEIDHWNDDLGFYNRAKKQGINLYCDLDTPIGHMAHVTIWPSKNGEDWITVYDTGGTGIVSFPAIYPEGAREGAQDLDNVVSS